MTQFHQVTLDVNAAFYIFYIHIQQLIRAPSISSPRYIGNISGMYNI